jgi:hypothetical protein
MFQARIVDRRTRDVSFSTADRLKKSATEGGFQRLIGADRDKPLVRLDHHGRFKSLPLFARHGGFVSGLLRMPGQDATQIFVSRGVPGVEQKRMLAHPQLRSDNRFDPMLLRGLHELDDTVEISG